MYNVEYIIVFSTRIILDDEQTELRVRESRIWIVAIQKKRRKYIVGYG